MKPSDLPCEGFSAYMLMLVNILKFISFGKVVWTVTIITFLIQLIMMSVLEYIICVLYDHSKEDFEEDQLFTKRRNKISSALHSGKDTVSDFFHSKFNNDNPKKNPNSPTLSKNSGDDFFGKTMDMPPRPGMKLVDNEWVDDETQKVMMSKDKNPAESEIQETQNVHKSVVKNYDSDSNKEEVPPMKEIKGFLGDYDSKEKKKSMKDGLLEQVIDEMIEEKNKVSPTLLKKIGKDENTIKQLREYVKEGKKHDGTKVLHGIDVIFKKMAKNHSGLTYNKVRNLNVLLCTLGVTEIVKSESPIGGKITPKTELIDESILYD
jgi:hypothetical protein